MNSTVKKVVIITLSIIVFVAIICAAFFVLTADQRSYSYAIEQYSIENYKEASNAFKQLGSYKDSETLYGKAIHQDAIEHDTQPPKITTAQDSISLTTDEPFVLKDWERKLRISVTDNVSGDLSYKIESDPIPANTPGTYNLYIAATDEAGNEGKKNIKVNITQADSATILSYRKAIYLKDTMLEKNGTSSYKYNGIPIDKDETVILKGELRVNQGALYRSLAKNLEEFYTSGKDYSNSIGEDTVKTIFGFGKPSTEEELKPHIDSTVKYINTINSILPIMLEFSQLSSVTGTFDFVRREFNFSIPNTLEAAEELGISEVMLGYILAFIDEYAPNVIAEGNRYSCDLAVYHPSVIYPLDYDDFVDLNLYSSYGCKDILSYQNGEPWMQWYGYEPNFDSSEEDIITTMRGIQIGSPKSDVFYAYGETEVTTFSENTDVTYYSMKQDPYNAMYAPLLLKQAATRLIYRFEDKGQIAFYLDSEDNITWIAIFSGVWY